MKNNIYLVTDPRENLLEVVEECCKNNIFAVQLRDKECSDESFVEQAKKIYSLCQEYGVKFFINDRVHLLDKIECDGVHIGQEDEGIKKVKRYFPNLEVGVSCHNLKEAKEADECGADYLGVGAMFPTNTKHDATIVSKSELNNMQDYNQKIIIIGGINNLNINEIPKGDYEYIAVSSYLLDAGNISVAIDKLINK
ncbi:thiamine phosphate synthase [Mycoplasma marinum]|uniref:Thiamine-phosphate synthase n=1 Tax=Mycoplasma marinum TaxID=1937190 RepID=A0A4R0XW43_9MOLU|nr:thiamine phosphate synthase [Mycoplasma marinum]TCG11181.1 thiamine phosphate synthase [Mycoplasma marinum]